MKPKLISTKELAQRYSVHDRTIAKWVRFGILPVIKINRRCVRFDIEECDAALERRTRIARQYNSPATKQKEHEEKK